jgi:hypothetical protein
MSVSLIYRIVAVLLVLFALGHTLGFNRVDPSWGVTAPITELQAIRFTAQGTPGRTYWGFYLGFGYFCSVLLVLAAALAWQVGSLPGEIVRRMQFLLWVFALAFAATSVITWKFFFTAPVVFSILITLGLIGGAWLARTA